MAKVITPFWVGVLWASFLFLSPVVAPVVAPVARTALAAPQEAWVLNIQHPIAPGSADYFIRNLRTAAVTGVGMVILRLDTPGGLDSSMREIIKAILDSPIPVAVYVAPSGAHAASAGTYILYAAHIAAMAPGTNIGAATPVNLQAGTGRGSESGQESEDAGEDEYKAATALERKMINDAAAYIRSLAELRGRNVEWAEQAVRSAESLSAQQALESNVIELIAVDTRELLQGMDGRTVEVRSEEITLETAHLQLREVRPDWRNQLLAAITDPNIAFLLLNVGFLALLMELYSPGLIVPGVVGVLLLLLGVYGLQLLPVNFSGLLLILVGLAFLTLEVFVTSFGILALAGLVALVLGALILFDIPDTGVLPGEWSLEVSRYLISAVAATGGLLCLIVLPLLFRAVRLPQMSGPEQLIGSIGEVVQDPGVEDRGLVEVRVLGEVWQARCQAPLRQGMQVRVQSRDHLLLKVCLVEEEER